jgi:hypothetical protein
MVGSGRTCSVGPYPPSVTLPCCRAAARRARSEEQEDGMSASGERGRGGDARFAHGMAGRGMHSFDAPSSICSAGPGDPRVGEEGRWNLRAWACLEFQIFAFDAGEYG